MARIRSCGYCGKLHRTNEICDKKPKRRESYGEDVKKQMTFYSTSKWQKLRELVKSDNNYMCQICKEICEVSYADSVHHIVPINENWELRDDIDNLIPVCDFHHSEIHKRNINNKEKLKKFINELKSKKNK